jgi:hypothetical protein
MKMLVTIWNFRERDFKAESPKYEMSNCRPRRSGSDWCWIDRDICQWRADFKSYMKMEFPQITKTVGKVIVYITIIRRSVVSMRSECPLRRLIFSVIRDKTSSCS